MKGLSVRGSTGSIGRQTLELVRKYPEELSVAALAANARVDLLEKQAREFRPRIVCVYDETAAKELRERLSNLEGTTVTEGMDGLLEAAACDGTDMTVVAVVGMIGIRPTKIAMQSLLEGRTVEQAAGDMEREHLVTITVQPILWHTDDWRDKERMAFLYDSA